MSRGNEISVADILGTVHSPIPKKRTTLQRLGDRAQKMALTAPSDLVLTSHLNRDRSHLQNSEGF